MKFLIDPAHGGTDSGAVGPGGSHECEIALAVSLMVAGHIRQGSTNECRLTSYSDIFITLDERCGLANDWADVLISIHCNAAESASATGFEVWTSPGWTPADPIATAIWQEFKQDFPYMRARLDTSDGDPDKESKFRVLVGTTMPAVLVELGFISNPEEEKRLLSPVFQTDAANAIARVLRGVPNG